MSKIDITITSYLDQPGLVAEIWCELGMFGTLRLNKETRSFVVDLFPIQGRHPSVDPVALEKEIAKAQRRILEIEGLPLDFVSGFDQSLPHGSHE